jgi:glycoprotein-N-acetylgalactosamine 3-beta-galactosyltransferase
MFGYRQLVQEQDELFIQNSMMQFYKFTKRNLDDNPDNDNNKLNSSRHDGSDYTKSAVDEEEHSKKINVHNKEPTTPFSLSMSDNNNKDNISTRRLIQSQRILQRKPVCQPQGPMDEISYIAIQKVQRRLLEQQGQQKATSKQEQFSSFSAPKVLCMVYTHQGSHDTYLRAIVDTWATQCDGFFAASNVTDESLGAIKLEFPGPESYSNMWQKVLAMWKYVHEHYIDDFDYFHISGDDTYLIPDNLRFYVNSEHVQKLLNGHMDEFSIMSRKQNQWKIARPRPLLFGFPIHSMGPNSIEQYAGGGCGYTLNREALRLFYETVIENGGTGYNQTDSREDILMSRVLAQHGITCADTRDDNGAFRYLPDNPMSEYRGLHKWPGRGIDRRVQCHGGLDAFSDETISIHLNYRKKSRWLPMVINYTEEIIYRYHDLLSGQCDSELLSFVPNMTKLALLDAVQRKRLGYNLAKRLEETFGLPSGFHKMEPIDG